MASRYSVFPCPVPAPTACICRNTINVTLADCLLAFHLNGIQVGLAAGPAAAAATDLGWVPPLTKSPCWAHFLGPLVGS